MVADALAERVIAHGHSLPREPWNVPGVDGWCAGHQSSSLPMSPRFSRRHGNPQAQRCPFCQDKGVKQRAGKRQRTCGGGKEKDVMPEEGKQA